MAKHTTHTHIAEDGTIYTHSHTNMEGTAAHPHHHESTKAVLNRMNCHRTYGSHQNHD